MLRFHDFEGSAGRLAGGPGFEPRLTGSEPVVLPLNYPPRPGRRVDLPALPLLGKQPGDLRIMLEKASVSVPVVRWSKGPHP